MSRLAHVAAAIAVALAAPGCSALFDGEDHLGPDEMTTSCTTNAECGPYYGGACDTMASRCIDCDADDDGYLATTTYCVDLLRPMEAADCNDGDASIYADVAPVCGDSVAPMGPAVCSSPQFGPVRNMWTTAGATDFAEAGRLPIAKLAVVGSRGYPQHQLTAVAVQSDGSSPEALVTWAGATMGSAPEGRASLLAFRWDLADSDVEVLADFPLNDRGAGGLAVIDSVAMVTEGELSLVAVAGMGGDGTGAVQVMGMMGAGPPTPGMTFRTMIAPSFPIALHLDPSDGSPRVAWREIGPTRLLRSFGPDGRESFIEAPNLSPAPGAYLAGSYGPLLIARSELTDMALGWTGGLGNPPVSFPLPSTLLDEGPSVVALRRSPTDFDYLVFQALGPPPLVVVAGLNCVGFPADGCVVGGMGPVPNSDSGHLVRGTNLPDGAVAIGMVQRINGRDRVTLRMAGPLGGSGFGAFGIPLDILDTARIDVPPTAAIEDLSVHATGVGDATSPLDIVVAALVATSPDVYEIWVTGLRTCTVP